MNEFEEPGLCSSALGYGTVADFVNSIVKFGHP